MPRITYLKGVVELMSPSRYHETDKKRFARLLEAWALRREADDVYRETPRSEFLPQLPVDILLPCTQEPDPASAVRALRARLAAA